MSQDDILAVSGIAEDIRDTILDYQVCDHKDSVGVAVELGKFDPPLWHAPYGRIV